MLCNQLILLFLTIANLQAEVDPRIKVTSSTTNNSNSHISSHQIKRIEDVGMNLRIIFVSLLTVKLTQVI